MEIENLTVNGVPISVGFTYDLWWDGNKFHEKWNDPTFKLEGSVPKIESVPVTSKITNIDFENRVVTFENKGE